MAKDIFADEDPRNYQCRAQAPGPKGSLPITAEFLASAPSGDIFGMTQNVGMGAKLADLNKPAIMIISTMGGATNPDGSPIALGLHTGHYQLGELVKITATEIAELGGLSYATYVSDPCDGRSQGTTGMFDSLPYRNDAAMVMRRLIRSLPSRRAVLGIASCDKGLPAMLIALASMHKDPTIVLPGGVTLAASDGEDNGSVQTIGVRFAAGEMTYQDAVDQGCRACASPGGGCQFLGTAATSQVIAEALGLALPHAALAPSGEPIWAENARSTAKALMNLQQQKIVTSDILTDHAIENAMVLHAAFGGSTNLLLHLPAIAQAAGLRIPTVDDWVAVNLRTPRIVSVLPIGPVNYPTSMVYLAGGVPEAMLQLADLGLLHLDQLTVTGQTLGENLAAWEKSARRAKLREILAKREGIDPTDVILTPSDAKAKNMSATVAFPKGNLAPLGAVVKSTAIDTSLIDEDGIFNHTGPAKVFTSERAAIKAIKANQIKAGDVMVVLGAGPLGTGMEETYQLTSALKKLPYGKHVSLITDARFSGVSTGACFGHVSPEALAGGPIAKLRDGDLISIWLDTKRLTGELNFIGDADHRLSPDAGAVELAGRHTHPGIAPDTQLPDDTRLWAALQDIGGGTWAGCGYDVEKILQVLAAGKAALAKTQNQ